jgi:hypothetical protein
MAEYKVMHYFEENPGTKEFLIMQYGSKASGWVPDQKTFERIYSNTLELAKQQKLNILLVPFYIEVNKEAKEVPKDLRRKAMAFFRRGTLSPILGVFKRKGNKNKEILKCVKCGKEIELTENMTGTEITCSCGGKAEKLN